MEEDKFSFNTVPCFLRSTTQICKSWRQTMLQLCINNKERVTRSLWTAAFLEHKMASTLHNNNNSTCFNSKLKLEWLLRIPLSNHPVSFPQIHPCQTANKELNNLAHSGSHKQLHHTLWRGIIFHGPIKVLYFNEHLLQEFSLKKKIQASD